LANADETGKTNEATSERIIPITTGRDDGIVESFLDREGQASDIVL